MESLRQELEAAGYPINVVAINHMGSTGTQDRIAAACTTDVLQDDDSVGAFSLLGGSVDDFFVYRAGGRLAPGGYLPATETNLTDPEVYENVRSKVIEAYELGEGEPCPGEGSVSVTSTRTDPWISPTPSRFSPFCSLGVGAAFPVATGASRMRRTVLCST